MKPQRAHIKNRSVRLRSVILLTALIVFAGVFPAVSSGESMDKVPPEMVSRIAAGLQEDVIVLFDDTAIREEISGLGIVPETPEILARKAFLYGKTKRDVIVTLPQGEYETLRYYSHLPMMALRIQSSYALDRLAENPNVVRIYENKQRQHFLTQSLPLIHQPQAASLGMTGGGTSVAVLDTGVDYTRSPFNCTAPNTPADTCKVIYAQDFAPNDGQPDVSPFHGTNVAGIALGVAPGTKIIALDVFLGSLAYDDDIIDAIDWCISNRAAYNIVAMNMSFGGGSSTIPCSTDTFATPITNAKAAGILSSVASGNAGDTNSLSSPACVPAAVSVGAVYDYTGSYGSCVAAIDMVTCFSNSASFLTMLAPGSSITAAGISMSGTSQAAPHVAGAIAVLKGTNAFPLETPVETVARMTGTGTPVLDTRNSITKPRIDLYAATGATTYSISGTVTTTGGSPLAGIMMTLGGTESRTTITDLTGNYSFKNVLDGSYTVTPSKTGYSFDPASRTVPVSGANVTGQDFTGTYTGPTYSISGKVQTYSLRTFLPLAGVTVTLSGAANKTATTDNYGNYSFAGLTNGTYTITPAKTGYTFTPTSRTVTVNNANLTGQNFTGIISSATYSISGRVTTGGTGLSGVTMTLSGAANRTTTTDVNGNYSFTGLANGTYTITPTLANYTFTPTSRTVSVSSANVTGQDFTGTSGTITYSISGTVTSGGTGLSGVTMTLSGAANKTTSTDANGNYSFTALANGSYTITPTLTNYTFSPASRTVPVSGANVTGQDFTGTQSSVTYSISGKVQYLPLRTLLPLSGVTVTLSGAATATTTTDSNGNYSFTGLANGAYTVTPQKSGYSFTPPAASVTINGQNVTGVNFFATQR